MRRIGMVLGVLVLVTALVFLNRVIGNNAQPDTDHDHAAPQTAAETQKTPAAAPASNTAPAFPPEEELGDTGGAKYHITVGWIYTPANQAKPDALAQALGAVGQAAGHGGAVAAEIVNLDVPAAQRSPAARAVTRLGISVNGKPLPGMSDNPGEGRTTAVNITRALQAAVR